MVFRRFSTATPQKRILENLIKNLDKNFVKNLDKNLVNNLVKTLAKNLVKNLANNLVKISGTVFAGHIREARAATLG